MPKGICRLCGCTEHDPCITKEGPCSWIFHDLCSACVVELDDGRTLVPKECRFCSELQEGKPWSWRGKTTWTCGRGRFDEGVPSPGHQWFAWSGIWHPNKTVAAAQQKCPSFAVCANVLDVCKLGRPAKQ